MFGSVRFGSANWLYAVRLPLIIRDAKVKCDVNYPNKIQNFEHSSDNN